MVHIIQSATLAPEMHDFHEPGDGEDSFSYGLEYLDFGKGTEGPDFAK
jgi:hypothetical protein